MSERRQTEIEIDCMQQNLEQRLFKVLFLVLAGVAIFHVIHQDKRVKGCLLFMFRHHAQIVQEITAIGLHLGLDSPADTRTLYSEGALVQGKCGGFDFPLRSSLPCISSFDLFQHPSHLTSWQLRLFLAQSINW